ncbi:MAG TPA: hypothetical protein VMB73_35465 [Acetobacteraceae bacterium]|nr:hypothetical protein [Acetobacteraceae bacterium]
MSHRTAAQAAAGELVAPGDDVGAGDGTEFLRFGNAGEAHELAHRGLVGAAGLGVGQVGEPFDLGRHVGEAVEFCLCLLPAG